MTRYRLHFELESDEDPSDLLDRLQEFAEELGWSDQDARVTDIS